MNEDNDREEKDAGQEQQDVKKEGGGTLQPVSRSELLSDKEVTVLCYIAEILWADTR